jgi:transcriptional regulator with XRE-family HTH domain
MMGKKTKVTSAQIRAARGLLNWSARELSERSCVSKSTIHRAEHAQGRPTMHEHSLAAIKAAIERYGVEFLDESGVRLGLKQDAGSQTVDLASKNCSVETQARWVPSNHS